MLEALWSVKFISNMQYYGSGVVIFESGSIYGGDNNYYYTGKYDYKNNIVDGYINIVKYGDHGLSVFGPLDRFELVVSGNPKQDKFTVDGHLKDKPDFKINIELTRQAELP